MVNINLRDDLLSILVADAKSLGLKPEERAEQILREALSPRVRRNRLFDEAERIAALTPKDVQQTDSTILVREDRDR